MKIKISQSRARAIKRRARENDIFKSLARQLMAQSQNFKADIDKAYDKKNKSICKLENDLAFLDQEYKVVPKKYANENTS